MTVNTRSFVLAAALTLATAGVAFAQPPRGRGERPQPPPGAAQTPDALDAPISAGKVAQMFDAYTVLQAQDALRLSEAQYGPFVTRLKALQDTRRRHQFARNKILADLRKQTNPQDGANDETVVSERLRTLRDEDDRATAELKKAFDAVDETLDIRQQARFRIFEERMEQQKFELLMKARSNARAAARGRGES